MTQIAEPVVHDGFRAVSTGLPLSGPVNLRGAPHGAHHSAPRPSSSIGVDGQLGKCPGSAPELVIPPARPVQNLPAGIEAILGAGDVRCVFQPIVDLASGATVAYEALTRGPVGTLESPADLYAAAWAVGRVADLDELCREVAVRSAIERGISAPLAVFVNVEPSGLRVGGLETLLGIAAAAPQPLQLVLEITERELAARPAELLAAVARLRSAGWRIALDDVGAVDMSLTFLSLINPDIVKIDMGVVQGQPDAETASLMNALNSYAERTGAVLLAEGVETEQHLASALALGARLGQGWKFGRPEAHPVISRSTAAVKMPPRTHPEPASSPFGCLPDATKTRVSSKALLIEVSKHLERQAAQIGSAAVVLSSFQHDRYFTGSTRDRYRRLAETVGFIAVFGQGMAPTPVAGVRGGNLTQGDPLAQEWDIVVLSPHFAAALLARDLTADHPEMGERERQFEFVLTYDRDTVTAAARSMMTRVHTKS